MSRRRPYTYTPVPRLPPRYTLFFNLECSRSIIQRFFLCLLSPPRPSREKTEVTRGPLRSPVTQSTSVSETGRSPDTSVNLPESVVAVFTYPILTLRRWDIPDNTKVIKKEVETDKRPIYTGHSKFKTNNFEKNKDLQDEPRKKSDDTVKKNSKRQETSLEVRKKKKLTNFVSSV